jgi:hypothetical protein
MENSDYSKAIQDIDTRLKVANYFRAILDADLLGSSDTEAKLVKERVRAFVGEELSYLMGVKKKEASNTAQSVSLTPEELTSIKQLVLLLTTSLAKKAANKEQTKEEPETAVATTEPVQSDSDKPKKKKKSAKDKSDELEKHKHLIPKKYLNDTTLSFKDGRVFVHLRDNDGNFRYKEDAKTGVSQPILRDVTVSQIQPNMPKPIPMPGPRFYEVMAANAPAPGEGLISGVNGAIRDANLRKNVVQQDEQFLGSPDFTAD